MGYKAYMGTMVLSYLQSSRGEGPLGLLLLDLKVLQDHSREQVQQDHGDDDSEAAEEERRQDRVATSTLRTDNIITGCSTFWL